MNISALGADHFLFKPRQCPGVDRAARPAMGGVTQHVDRHHTSAADHRLHLHHAVIGVDGGTGSSAIPVSLDIGHDANRRCAPRETRHRGRTGYRRLCHLLWGRSRLPQPGGLRREGGRHGANSGNGGAKEGGSGEQSHPVPFAQQADGLGFSASGLASLAYSHLTPKAQPAGRAGPVCEGSRLPAWSQPSAATLMRCGSRRSRSPRRPAPHGEQRGMAPYMIAQSGTRSVGAVRTPAR